MFSGISILNHMLLFLETPNAPPLSPPTYQSWCRSERNHCSSRGFQKEIGKCFLIDSPHHIMQFGATPCNCEDGVCLCCVFKMQKFCNVRHSDSFSLLVFSLYQLPESVEHVVSSKVQAGRTRSRAFPNLKNKVQLENQHKIVFTFFKITVGLF